MTATGLGALALCLFCVATAALLRLRATRRALVRLQTEAQERASALSESEAFMRTLTETGQASLVVTDRTDRLRHINSQWLALFGYAQEDVPDLRAATMHTDGETARRRLQTLMQPDGSLRHCETRFRRKDGTQFWGLMNSSRVRIGDELLRVTWIIDNTEEHVAAERLRSLAAEQQMLLQNLQVGIVYTGDGMMLRANARFAVMFGFADTDSPVGLGTGCLFHDQAEVPRFGAEVGKAFAAGAVFSGEWRAARQDGSVFDAYARARSIAHPDYQQATIWMIDDITERKRSEEALRVAHAAQLAIFETASVGIAILREGTILRCNRALEEIFGYGPGQLEGQPTRIWYASEGAYAAGRELANARIGQASRHDQQLQRKDGTLFWCRMQARYIEANSEHGSVWVMEDVTEENAAAQALREAKRLADEATQAKSMFLANMSHEIRTPMNAVIGLSRLALKTDVAVKQRDYITKVHGAGTALLGIINDILDFSKIEAGKLEIESVAFRLDDVFANLPALVGQRASDKGLELVLDVAHDVPTALVGDPLRLGQVVTNLVGNAVKFTEHGHVLVRATQRERAAGAMLLRVEVFDTGIGMAPEQTGRLFQAFSQADGSTTRKYGGTGLGLTICKRLVEAMGGSIDVRSAPGQGSCFGFTARVGWRVEHDAPDPLPEVLHGMRALVVDDNTTAREVFASQLQALGFSVLAVADGTQAIAAVCREDFGLLLLDWAMPHLNGLSVLERLPQTHRPARIVMACGFGQDELRQQAERAGVDAFVVKPVSPTTLRDTIRNLFSQDPSQAPQQTAQGPAATPLRGLRLLLAEDNEINQQIAVELLESAGATVTVADHGRMALDLLEQGHRFDAVLMDLQMPVMDGMQATRLIRADARFAQLPIIAMTAHAMVEERERCLAAGMVDHITKPIDPPAMLATLVRWVQPHGDMPAGAAAAALPEPGEALTVLAGLDTAAGLARVGGKQTLYLRLLRQFHDRQADAGTRIAAALAAHDQASAERIAHTVRGVAGNLGLDDVQQRARSLEETLGAGSPPALALAAFEGALAAAVAGLQGALPAVGAHDPRQQPGATEPSAAARADAERHAAHLAALLAASDGEACDYFGTHRGVLRQTLGDSAVAQLAGLIDSYDFDAALDQLYEAAQAHSVPL